MSDRTEYMSGPLVQVFETADLALLPVIKSVFEAAGIPFVTQGETSLGLIPTNQPLVSRHAPLLRAILLVPADQEAYARAVLEAYSQATNDEDESF